MKLRNIKEGKTMPYVLWVLDGDDRQWKMYKGVNDAKKFIADNDYDEFLDALNTQVFPNATYHNNYIDWIVIPAGEEPKKFDTHKFYNALRTESNKVTKKKSMKESYSDIEYDNLWEAYDIAADVLGYEELCLSLAKAMGEDELLSNLKYIFRTWDIPFMDDEEDYGFDDYDECLDEANVVGMGGGYPNAYLPKAAKEYLKRRGFQEVDTEIGPCFYMRFTGNDVWEIYIDEQYGGIYVVQEGYELSPTDDIATIDDYDYKDDIDAVINLGNCLSNGEDFDSCLKAFFN